MAKKPKLKTTVTNDKLVFELSIEYIRDAAEGWNRIARQLNRKNPLEDLPTYRITNAKAFMTYLAKCLMTGTHGVEEKLPTVFSYAIPDVLTNRYSKNTGVLEIPFSAPKSGRPRVVRQRPAVGLEDKQG